MKAVRIHEYGDVSVLRYENAPLAETAAAHLRSQERHARGKIVIRVTDPT